MQSTFNEKQWVLFSHLSGFAGFFFPLGNILGPLLIWLLKREQSMAVEQHAREALNFQISITIYMFAAAILMIIGIGFLIVLIMLLVQVILMIKAALQADKGGFYIYPITIRLIN